MAHRSYLPFLQFWANCTELTKSNSLSIYGHSVAPSDPPYFHLSETVSDIGSGLFCCIQGAYKPAHMALRSGIENFLRFGAGVTCATALTTTSVRHLFELSKNEPMFRNPRDKKLLGDLKDIYTELCKFTHSTTAHHMAGIQAFEHFPAFNSMAFHQWIQHAKKTMSTMVTATIRGAPNIYLSAHYTAKEIIEHILPREETEALLRGER